MINRKTPEQHRKADLAKMAIARKQLGLDEDIWRDMIEQASGQRSAAKLNSAQRCRLLQELNSLGWHAKPAPKWGRKPRVTAMKQPLMDKLEALLADNGLRWVYADSIARRMFKIDRVAWLNGSQLHKLVAALQIAVNRTNQR